MWYELSNYLRHEKKILGNILPLVVAFFFFSLGWSIVGPIFAIQINEITQDIFLTGIFFSLWGITRFVFDFPVGILSDKIDTKRLLVIASFIYIFIALSYTIVDNVAGLFILRIAHGLFGSLLWVGTWTMLRYLPDKSHIEENIGFFAGVRSIPIVAGPILGTFIISLYSWQWAFYISSFCMLLMFIIVKFKLPHRKIKKNDSSPMALIKHELGAFKRLGKTARMLMSTLIVLFLINSMFGNFLPILLNETFSITEIGIILAAVPLPYIVLSIPVGKYADKKGRKGVIMLGSLIGTFGFLMFAQSAEFIGYVTSILIINIGYAIISPTINSVVSDAVIDGQAGGFSGITEVFKDAGQIIGPLVGGILIERWNFNAMVYTSAIFSLLIFFIVLSQYSDDFIKEFQQ